MAEMGATGIRVRPPFVCLVFGRSCPYLLVVAFMGVAARERGARGVARIASLFPLWWSFHAVVSSREGMKLKPHADVMPRAHMASQV